MKTIFKIFNSQKNNRISDKTDQVLRYCTTGEFERVQTDRLEKVQKRKYREA